MTVVDRVRVGDVLRLERREVTIEPSESYRLVGVYSFGKGIFHRDPQPGADLGDYRFFRVEPGDLVLSNIQAWESAIAFAGAADAGTIGTHRFLTYVPVDDSIDTNWARWFLLSEPGMSLIRRAAPGTAVRNRTLAVKRFEDLVIPLPPIEDQRRVAGRLDRTAGIAGGLADRLHRVQHLSRAAQTSLTTARENHSSTRWPETPLGEVLAPSDVRVPVDGSARYRIAGTYSFGKGLIDRGDILGSETSYTTMTRIETGNVVVSKLNGWEGAVAVVDPPFHNAYVSSEYPTFVLDQERIIPGFFRGIARSPVFWALLDANVRGSMVRRRRLNAGDFMRVSIHLPPMEEQRHIANLIDELDRISQRHEASTERGAAVVAALLNREFGDLA